MADDLISRSALIQRLAYYHAHSYGKAEYAYSVAAQEVQNAPAVDAVPVVHARWKWEGRYKACSECGTYINWDNTLGAGHWHYCPNCGAKMDGGSE